MNEISRNKIWKETCILSPSLICLDMLNLKEQINDLEKNGVKMLHVDILDGHFSPSMPLGFELVRQLRKVTDLEFECHVMASSPAYFIDELMDIGVAQIVFHVETALHVDNLINHIHSGGVRAGLALMPSTSLSVLDYELDKCDAVLLMQINPGFASNPTEGKVPFMNKKILQLRKMIDQRNAGTKIILDGRVSLKDIEDYGNGMVDIFVGGTTCINKNAIAESVSEIIKVRSGVSDL